MRGGRYIPFAVASTGEEGTGITGTRLAVWCARCEKAIVLPPKWTLAAIVDVLDSGKRLDLTRFGGHPDKPGEDQAQEFLHGDQATASHA